ncbi:EmrB/QacA subfamily drug resistance transporter OS=Streptomyces griseomycini OX=66895 GN=FHS37_004139 PE=4 SV=1 [Streptomyces griseomycini]
MDSTRPATRDTPQEPRTDRRGAVVAALMLAMALAALDSTVVSTAVPQIVGDLGGFSYFSWLFSGYLLAVTVTLPVYGRLSDTFGRKPVLVAGAVLFLLGSLLCALAWNMAALVAFRIVQGLGGGALQGTVQTLAADLYPLEQRPKIQARLSTVWAVSAVAGPGLGGLLASYADWRWIFLVNLPVGAVALWLIVRHLREPARERAARARVDWAGALAVFACGGVLLTALVQGGVAWPWLSAPSLALTSAGLVLLAVVVVVERRAADPIIPGWVWRRRTIAAVNLALGALGLLSGRPDRLPAHLRPVGARPRPRGRRIRVLRVDVDLAGLGGPQPARLPQDRLPQHRDARHRHGRADPLRVPLPPLPRRGLAAHPADAAAGRGAGALPDSRSSSACSRRWCGRNAARRRRRSSSAARPARPSARPSSARSPTGCWPPASAARATWTR